MFVATLGLLSSLLTGCAFRTVLAQEDTDEIAPEDPGSAPIPPFGRGKDGSATISDDSVSGICFSLTSGEGTEVTLAGYSDDLIDSVLVLIQIQDANVAQLGVPGPIVEFAATGTAGAWEVAHSLQLKSANADGSATLTLAANLTNTFVTDDSGRAAQACVAREYETLTLEAGGRIAANPWNGRTGGFVTFFAHSLVLDGEIDVAMGGFRGGNPSLDSSIAPGEHALDTTDRPGAGAGKGEGIDGISWGRMGRGSLANSAGGGNARNAGGGGGGGAAAGGVGGWQWAGASNPEDPDVQGQPGVAVDFDASSRLILGGGGGGGHQDNGLGGIGGAGGGIALIFAQDLRGAGRIFASGAAARSRGTSDGAGGGGGGGTIAVYSESGEFTGTISATGGQGGNAGTSQGPGGGGGGGRVALPAWLVGSVALEVAGGASGVAGTSGSRGAQAGSLGVTQTWKIE